MKSLEFISLVRIVGITLYFFIAAQGAFYHLGFGKALYNIPADDFIELRKAVDPVIRGRLKALYLTTLAVMFIWFLLADKTAGFLSYAPVMLAFLLLIADMVLIVKFSEPLNARINEGSLNTETSYHNARSEWLKFIFIRGYLSVSGFLLLLIHIVFKLK